MKKRPGSAHFFKKRKRKLATAAAVVNIHQSTPSTPPRPPPTTYLYLNRILVISSRYSADSTQLYTRTGMIGSLKTRHILKVPIQALGHRFIIKVVCEKYLLPSGQSYKHNTIVNYYSTDGIKANLYSVRIQSRKLRS